MTAAARYAGIAKSPLSLRDLVGQLLALPESVTFHQEIETGAALRGDATVVLHRDGTVRFTGHMNATGFPSFSYRIGAVVRGGSGGVMLAMSASGKVFGGDSPGKHKESHWEQSDVTEQQRKAIANL